MHKYTDNQKKAVLAIFEQGSGKREISEKLELPYHFVLSVTTEHSIVIYYKNDGKIWLDELVF